MVESDDSTRGRWQQDLEEVARTISELWNGLTEEQRRWKANPKSWSVAECIEHLRTTNAAYRPRLERALADARETGRTASKPYAPGRIARWFHAQIDPARSKRALPAPKVFQPSRDATDPAVLSGFHEEQDALLRLLRDCAGLDLNRARLSSPATGLLRLSVGEAFETLILHEQRHLRQARRVLESPGFPS
ncbi:MAG: DinB family protein [Candidatus Eisenbacteria bacterium]|uniref:DinB family protein n=1 Tax=Eiseniibacteriota bacterium TaxID=2212470 RepID=A0A956LZ54_UNCEI|nr:DinB family protein [Candidatus Eisenbacteria bacterium]